ncbi:sigma-70 family RNA polymerase sigma factor [Candidatus Pacearchaeota archaeon]|nr:sigma-70 family RNA polymerase sigma factor [Candidatus Pacearchaeota archaeon]
MEFNRNGWRVVLKRDSRTYGRLQIYERREDEPFVSLRHSNSLLEKISTGNFRRPISRRKSELDKIKIKYLSRVGPEELEKNLAYALLAGYPKYSSIVEIPEEFTPLSNEDLSSLIDNLERAPSTLTREEQEIFFSNMIFHKKDFYHNAISILESDTTPSPTELSELVRSYCRTKAISDFLFQKNIKLIYLARNRYESTLDDEEKEDVGWKTLFEAVHFFSPWLGWSFTSYFMKSAKKNLRRYKIAKGGKRVVIMNLEYLENASQIRDSTSDAVELLEYRRQKFEEAMKSLTERERFVINQRYLSDGERVVPQQEVAQLVSLTPGGVGEVEKRAKRKIREYVEKNSQV